MYQEDYLLRLIQQLAAFIAQIADHNQRGEHDQALAAADQAWGKLLEDTPHELIDTVDTLTLAGMLRDPAKIRAAAQLFVEEGRAFASQGNPQRAAARFRRAMELIYEARALDAPAKASAPAPAPPGAASHPATVKLGPVRPAPGPQSASKQAPGKPDPARQDDAILRELSRVVPVETLDPRYRART